MPEPPDTQRITALEVAVQNLMDLLALEKRERQKKDEECAPVGTVGAYAGDTLPIGWLLCNNDAVSRTQYAELFQVIGTKHGLGDGSTTFNVPDYRGRFLRGVSSQALGRDTGPRHAMNQGAAIDGIGSVEDWSTGMPRNPLSILNDGAHTHVYSHYSGRVPIYNGVELNLAGSDHPIAKDNLIADKTSTDGTHTHHYAGGDGETRPANVAVNFIIKH